MKNVNLCASEEHWYRL